jgi:SAM-dependent methyltransferase
MVYRKSVSKLSIATVSVLDFVFKHSLGLLPFFKNYSPDINILGNTEKVIKELLEKELLGKECLNGEKLSFLDIGARDGIKTSLAAGYNYTGMDISPASEDVIFGDICDCPDIPDNTYDVVFSMDVLEHVKYPWKAAKESIRITKPGGLIIHRTLFAYRYHPCPEDYWRYTSQGLELLFTDSNETTTVLKGYETRKRRRNHRGSNARSKPPIDWLGGFRENWQVLWIGRKNLQSFKQTAKSNFLEQ